RPQPRDRVVHGAAVPPPSPAGTARAAPRVPGFEPDQRRLVAGSAALGIEVFRAGGGGSRRSRGAGEDAACGLLCRSGIRQRGRASSARDVLSGLVNGARLPVGGLSWEPSG